MIIITRNSEKAEAIALELLEKLKGKGIERINCRPNTFTTKYEIFYEDFNVKNRIKIISLSESTRGYRDNMVLYDGSVSDYTSEEYLLMQRMLIHSNDIQKPTIFYPYSFSDKILFKTLRYAGEE